MFKVLITCMHLVRHFESFRQQYEAVGIDAYLPELKGQQFSAEEMLEHIDGMDAAIVGDDFITAEVLSKAKAGGLKALVKWGIGTDSIDKEYAKSIELPVYNTPGVFGEEVADLAISHLLMLFRKTHLMDASVRAGGWLKEEGRSISGLTAGVIGFGSIGQAIARRALGFGMKVNAYDVRQNLPDAQDMGVSQVDIDTLLGAADVVFVACALTPESHHLINRDTLARVKRGAYIINVARGPLVDEIALAEALETGQITGAGLDVFETEPLPMDSGLRRYADRCTFSTHNGSNTREAVMRINQMTTDIVFGVLEIRDASFAPNRVA